MPKLIIDETLPLSSTVLALVTSLTTLAWEYVYLTKRY